MSLLSFIGSIIIWIKRKFARLPAELKSAVHIGVSVVQAFKAMVDSPVADILTAIIPTTIDDLLKEKLRQYLPVILAEMRLVDVTLNLTDPEQIVAAALKFLADMNPDYRAGKFLELSILIAQVAADGKLSWSDGVYILQYYYKEEFQPAA